MARLREEIRFIGTLLGINLSSAMAYRASFLTQVVGMFINNGIYLLFWLIFFEQFGTVRGYEGADILLLFAVVAVSYGIGLTLAGNISFNLSYLIAQGRLDYYLVLPRALLPHIIFSRLQASAMGDLIFGSVLFLFTGLWHPVDLLLFVVVTMLAASLFVSFGIIVGSLAFFMGNAQNVSAQAFNATLTFALYPNTLFSGGTRLILYTLLPAAFVGAVPVAVIQERDGLLLLGLAGAALVFMGLATIIFYRGLRRYESGSAINLNV